MVRMLNNHISEERLTKLRTKMMKLALFLCAVLFASVSNARPELKIEDHVQCNNPSATQPEQKGYEKEWNEVAALLETVKEKKINITECTPLMPGDADLPKEEPCVKPVNPYAAIKKCLEEKICEDKKKSQSSDTATSSEKITQYYYAPQILDE